jgi:transporter family-2 protein
MNLALVLLAFTAGGLVALQSGINNTLRTVLRAPIGATLISFAVGIAVLLVMVVVTGEGIPNEASLRSVPWWGYLGGPLGVVGVAGTILLIPRLGAATTVALNITGQMLTSLVLDGESLLGVPYRAVSAERALGAVVVVLGAVLISWQGSRRRLTSTATTSPDDGLTALERGPLAPRLLGLAGGLLIGTVLPIQSAINARLRSGLDAPFTASSISFGGGVLILLLLVLLISSQRPRRTLLSEVPGWAFLGGVCGAVYVASTVILVPEFGTAVTTALIVSGQNVVSLALDHFGWVRLPRRPATARRVAGVALLLVGVVLIELG